MLEQKKKRLYPSLRRKRVWAGGQIVAMSSPSEGSAGLGHSKQLIWEPIQIQGVLWVNGQTCELKVLCH